MKATVYHNGKATTLVVSGKANIEELIVRAGWTVLDDAEMTKRDEVEVEAIRAKGYAESQFADTDYADRFEWWQDRVVAERPAFTPDM